MRINIYLKKFFLLIFILNYFFCWTPVARAASLTATSVSVTDTKPLATTNYTVNFTAGSTQTLKRIDFFFERAIDSPYKPVSLLLTDAVLSSITGLSYGNWNFDTTQTVNGILTLRYEAGEEVHIGDQVSVVFGNIRNAELGECTKSYSLFDVCYIETTTYLDSGNTAVDHGGSTYQIEEEPSLKFSVSGVDQNIETNGITTDRTSTYDEINFGPMIIRQPVFMAQKLNVSTTASRGYLVTMKLDGYIQGLQPNNQITPFLPTNGAWNSPKVWVSPEGATNSESGWVGANTSDTRIDQYLGLTNIWSAGNGAGKFGPVSSTEHPLMYCATKDRNGTDAYVTYGIEANEKQPPDAYAGVIQYNALTTY